MGLKIIFCINCGAKLSKWAYQNNSKRCNSCKQKGKLNHAYKSGLPKCMDCGKQLGDWRSSFCLKCMHKGERNPRFNIHEFGNKAPNWQGGKVSLIKQVYSLKKYSIWRNKCFKRDKFKCQCCGKSSSGRLNVHHKITLSNLLNQHHIKNLNQAVVCRPIWSTKNGITLCEICHYKAHGKLK